MVSWDVVQSLLEDLSDITAFNGIGRTWTSVVCVCFQDSGVDIVRVDTLKTGSLEANPKAPDAAEQVDKCGRHGASPSSTTHVGVDTIAGEGA